MGGGLPATQGALEGAIPALTSPETPYFPVISHLHRRDLEQVP